MNPGGEATAVKHALHRVSLSMLAFVTFAIAVAFVLRGATNAHDAFVSFAKAYFFACDCLLAVASLGHNLWLTMLVLLIPTTFGLSWMLSPSSLDQHEAYYAKRRLSYPVIAMSAWTWIELAALNLSTYSAFDALPGFEAVLVLVFSAGGSLAGFFMFFVGTQWLIWR